MTTILAVILRAIKHAINHGSQGLCWIKRVLRHTLFFKLDYDSTRKEVCESRKVIKFFDVRNQK